MPLFTRDFLSDSPSPFATQFRSYEMIFASVTPAISESDIASVFLGSLLSIAVYLYYVGTWAKTEIHSLIGRYITTTALTVCLFGILAPICMELTGVFGDFRYIVVGVIFLFPTFGFRNLISNRKQKWFGEKENSKIQPQ